MKKKQFMSKLAALTMAAMMTATVLPASAVSVLADNTASVTIDADATNNPTEDQLKTALGTISSNSDKSSYITSVRTTASTLEKYIAAALKAEDALKTKTYSVTVTSLSTSKAPTYSKGAVVYGTLSGTVQIKENSASASSEYNFTLDANTLDDQDKADVAAAAAKYAIEQSTFAASGTVLTNDVKALTANALTTAGIGANGSVAVTISSQPESTKSTAGSVAGTVTVTYTVNSGATNEKTYTATADYSAKRAAATHSLTSALATSVASNLEAETTLFANDVTADEVANYIESLKHSSDTIGSGSATLADDGISAEVSNVTIKKAATHGTAGSAIVVFTLTEDGSDPQIKTATIALRQSDDDIFAEAEANITASAKAIDETNAKKEGKTDYTSVDEDAALTDAKKVLSDAWAAKVGTADDAVALSADEYTGKSPAAGLAKLTASNKSGFKKFSFTAPTINKEGKLTATYTLVINDGDATDGTASSTTTKDVTFTLTYPKLSKKAATKIELGNAQTLAKSATLDLSAKVMPAGANDVTWTSSNPDVASVDATGKVTAKAAGTTTVTATSSTNNLLDSVVITVTNTTLPFVDVQDPGKYYYSHILTAYTNHLTVGITPTEFGVNETVKRGQFVFWLYKFLGNDTTGYADPGFTDVSSTAYYADAVAWAKAKGITGGTTATTFSPDADVTRAQAVTMLYKALGSEKATVTKQFSDVPVNKWYTDAVAWAYTKGVTAGTSDTTFSPDQVCTRAQAMTFIMTAVNPLKP